MLSNWPVLFLVSVVALVFRWQGDSWLVVVKLMGLLGLVLAVVVVLGIIIARQS